MGNKVEVAEYLVQTRANMKLKAMHKDADYGRVDMLTGSG